jgi:hypothetical protein
MAQIRGSFTKGKAEKQTIVDHGHLLAQCNCRASICLSVGDTDAAVHSQSVRRAWDHLEKLCFVGIVRADLFGCGDYLGPPKASLLCCSLVGCGIVLFLKNES